MQDELRRAVDTIPGLVSETLLDGEKRLLEMVASGRSLPVVLDALCGIVEAIAGDCHCSVLLIDRSGTTVQHGAAPSLRSTYTESIHGRPVISAGFMSVGC
jgi:hypothetical protein